MTSAIDSNEPTAGSPVKQVIVLRKDLKMRRGKEIAQGSHASAAFITKRLEEVPDRELLHAGVLQEARFSPVELQWMAGEFRKIVCYVESEGELEALYESAKAADLTVHMVTDLGATEFHGVPTKTCIAIGPNYSHEIDPLTRHLKLY